MNICCRGCCLASNKFLLAVVDRQCSHLLSRSICWSHVTTIVANTLSANSHLRVFWDYCWKQVSRETQQYVNLLPFVKFLKLTTWFSQTKDGKVLKNARQFCSSYQKNKTTHKGVISVQQNTDSRNKTKLLTYTGEIKNSNRTSLLSKTNREAREMLLLAIITNM